MGMESPEIKRVLPILDEVLVFYTLILHNFCKLDEPILAVLVIHEGNCYKQLKPTEFSPLEELYLSAF